MTACLAVGLRFVCSSIKLNDISLTGRQVEWCMCVSYVGVFGSMLLRSRLSNNLVQLGALAHNCFEVVWYICQMFRIGFTSDCCTCAFSSALSKFTLIIHSL